MEEVSPGLAEYAIQHPTLHDTIPEKFASLKHYLLVQYVLLPLVGVGMIWSFTLWTSLMLEKDATPLGVVLTAPFLLCWYGGLGLYEVLMGNPGINWRLPRSVRVRQGYLIVDRPIGRNRYRLSDCCWFEGSTSVTDDVFVMPARSAIVIEPPPFRRYRYSGYGRGRHYRIAVGFTAADRERWIGLLKLSGCRRRRAVSLRDFVLLFLIVGSAGFGVPLVLRLLGF
jgi:hypothetical protein